ncbi:hypothetical protein [Polaromonas jejuensis]|uniref:hypothetical protein n=1 Tax=Polaromonas jejuensis TaxID=457502 RepID=UPI00366FB0EA
MAILRIDSGNWTRCANSAMVMLSSTTLLEAPGTPTRKYRNMKARFHTHGRVASLGRESITFMVFRYFRLAVPAI